MRNERCADGAKRELTVGEVARRSGVAVSALHFYETKGLIKSWRKRGTSGGMQGRAAAGCLIQSGAENGIPLLAIRRR